MQYSSYLRPSTIRSFGILWTVFWFTLVLVHFTRPAPCMKADATQHLLEDEEVKFWGNSIWPGNNLDMNPAENIGAIIKDKVEELMASEDRQNRYNHDILKTNLENTLKDLENDTDLFIDLLYATRKRFDVLKAAVGGHTNF